MLPTNRFIITKKKIVCLLKLFPNVRPKVGNSKWEKIQYSQHWIDPKASKRKKRVTIWYTDARDIIYSWFFYGNEARLLKLKNILICTKMVTIIISDTFAFWLIVIKCIYGWKESECWCWFWCWWWLPKEQDACDSRTFNQNSYFSYSGNFDMMFILLQRIQIWYVLEMEKIQIFMWILYWSNFSVFPNFSTTHFYTLQYHALSNEKMHFLNYSTAQKWMSMVMKICLDSNQGKIHSNHRI